MGNKTICNIIITRPSTIARIQRGLDALTRACVGGVSFPIGLSDVWKIQKKEMEWALISQRITPFLLFDKSLAVLADAKSRGVDGLINLGDILYGPLAPRETYDLLQTYEMITIKGNQDRQIYETTDSEIASNPTMQFILSDLGNDPLQWMKALPAVKSLKNDLFLCHGTPENDLVYMLEDVSEGCAKVRPDSEILNFTDWVEEKVILCGHTHTPRSVHLSNGKLVINPGSVGLPAYFDDEPIPHKMESYANLASYCIIESTSSGWQVEHIKIPYKHNYVIQAAKQRNHTDWAVALAFGRTTI